MNQHTIRFSILLNRYLEKTATTAELHELADLLAVLDEKEIEQVLKPIYQQQTNDPVSFSDIQSDAILARILKQSDSLKSRSLIKYPKRNLKPLLHMAIAALVAGITFSFIYFFSRTPSDESIKHLAGENIIKDISPGGNRATLKMANGRVILLDTTKNGILAKDQAVEVTKVADGKLTFHTRGKTYPQAFNSISTPRGGQYQITLPDGSRVWLNAETSLKFPSQFIGSERLVQLDGEAYFEIAKQVDKPFKVQTNHLEVQVLGTDFNLSDYHGDDTPKATLIQGSVKIKSGSQTQLLKPEQQVVLTKNRQLKLVTNIDIETEIAWKNGVFLFKDASLDKVMHDISRWYDIEVAYQGAVPKKLVNGTVPRHVYLSEFMNMLAYMGIHYKMDGRKIIITN